MNPMISFNCDEDIPDPSAREAVEKLLTGEDSLTVV